MKKSKYSSPAGSLMLAFTAALVPCGAAAIINEDFEAQTPGVAPTTVLVNGASQTTGIRPSTNDTVDTDGDGLVLTQVVNGAANTAGTGNGLQLIDDDLTSTDSTGGYEVDVVPNAAASPVSNLHVSFDVAWTNYAPYAPNGVINGTDAFRMGLGAFNGSDSLELSSTSRRFCTVPLQNDGQIVGFSGTTQLTSGVPVSIELFANDSDTETISYSPPGGGSANLGPNMVALYVGGTLEGTTMLTDNSGAPVPLAGDYNIGRFGFASFNSAFGLSYVIDNLVIDEIKESTVLLIEGFETQTLGDNPSATRSSPSNPEIENEEALPNFPGEFWLDDLYVLVIPEVENLAGTGQAVEILDKKTDAGFPVTQGSTGLGWDLVPSAAGHVSTLKFSMDFVWRNEGLPNPVYFGIGDFGFNMGSSSNRDLSARFGGDGYFQVDDGGSSTPGLQLTHLQKYTFTAYLNDKDSESVTYKDPGGLIRLLSPNTGAFFIDNTFVGSMDYRDQLAAGDPIYLGDNNIGRVGFATTTGETAGGLIIDNVFASEIVPATGTPVLYVQTFETYTAGGAVPVPPGGKSKNATVVSGAANVAGGGTGKGMKLIDILGNSGDGSDFDLDFPTVGNVHISLDAAWNQLNAGADPSHRFKIRVGQTGKQMSSGARAYFDVGLSATGVLEFPESVEDPKPTLQLADDTAVHIDLFVNDNDTNPVDYPVPGGGTASLPAESWAIYVDGVFVFQDVFDSVTDPLTGTAGDTTLGRFGIVSSSADVDLEYTFDNIIITPIPEISTEPETLGPVTIVATQPDTVSLTFDTVIGNEYRIWQSTGAGGTISFSILTTITATSTSTTYIRNGVNLLNKEFFRVEDLGPPAS